MKLDQWIQVLSVSPEKKNNAAPFASYTTKKYDVFGKDCSKQLVITASFETGFRNKSSSTPPSVLHRKKHIPDTYQSTPKQHAVIHSSNPISLFLNDAPMTTPKDKKKIPMFDQRVPSITQNRWPMRATVPLIQWLHKLGVRYSYADWECYQTNRNRVRTVSQYGVVLDDREVSSTAEYMCKASFGDHLYVRTHRIEYVPSSKSMYNWWSDVKSGAVVPLGDGSGTTHIPMAFSIRPSEYVTQKASKKHQNKALTEDTNTSDQKKTEPDGPLETTTLSYADCGVYSQIRQHRMYQWDAANSIHLTTTDGKEYRIWIEHSLSEDGEKLKEFRKLLSTLSYHLSFYMSKKD
jgi:hypothetical protein